MPDYDGLDAMLETTIDSTGAAVAPAAAGSAVPSSAARDDALSFFAVAGERLPSRGCGRGWRVGNESTGKRNPSEQNTYRVLYRYRSPTLRAHVEGPPGQLCDSDAAPHPQAVTRGDG